MIAFASKGGWNGAVLKLEGQNSDRTGGHGGTSKPCKIPGILEYNCRIKGNALSPRTRIDRIDEIMDGVFVAIQKHFINQSV
jgi:hypothetical protein